MEQTMSKYEIWDYFTKFISIVGNVIEERYWFSIRGECHMSLCTLMNLTASEYSKFLFFSELVTFKRSKSGGYQVMTSITDTWQPRIVQSNLHCSGRNLLEATLTKMEVGGLMKKTTNMPSSLTSRRKGMHMLGVGRYEAGVTTNAAFQVRDAIALPEYQRLRKIRSAQLSFYHSIKPLLEDIDCSPEETSKLIAMKDWVQLLLLEEDFEVYCLGPPVSSLKAHDTEDVSPVKKHASMDIAAPRLEELLSPMQESRTSSCNDFLADLKSQEEQRVSQLMLSKDGSSLSEITTKTCLYPKEHSNSKYPLLNSLNIDVMNRDPGLKGQLARNQMQALLREIVAFNEANKDPNEFTSSGGGQHLSRLVKIPVAENSRDFRSKAKKYNWIEETLRSSITSNSMEDALNLVLDYLTAKHNQMLKDQLTSLSLCPKQMTEYQMAATMKAANIGITQWREIVKCLVTFTNLEREQFTTSEYAWRKLGTDHGQIESGKIEYRTEAGKRLESIPWWTMDPVRELEICLTDFANQCTNFNPTNIKTIASIYTGDHGKGKLRFGAKLVVRTDVNGSTSSYSTIYPLADVKCKKDTGEIFKRTVKDNLSIGINRVEHGKVQFKENKDNETQRWYCTILDPDHEDFKADDDTIKEVVPFIIGDLKFLSMMLGKENFDTGHCFQCTLYIDEWQKKDHEPGECWTLAMLKEQAKKFERLTGRARRGVREPPYFDVPVSRFIWPILHILIGVGNSILDHLIDVIENEIQLIPPKELLMRRELGDVDRKHKDQQALRDYFDGSNEDSGSERLKKHKQQKRQCENLMDRLEDAGREESEEYSTLWNTAELCKMEIKTLEAERKAMTGRVEAARKAITKKRMLYWPAAELERLRMILYTLELIVSFRSTTYIELHITEVT